MGFLEHQIDEEQERYGYTPSSWLRFVLTHHKDQQKKNEGEAKDSFLNYPLGDYTVPVPLRQYPYSPAVKNAFS